MCLNDLPGDLGVGVLWLELKKILHLKIYMQYVCKGSHHKVPTYYMQTQI